MPKHILTILISLVLNYAVNAQYVETMASHALIRDALHVDDLGNIYTASGGYANGISIGKYHIVTERYEPFFATGFRGPIDIDAYQDSMFVVTNYDDNTASSYNLNTGEVRVIATGLDGPAGIAVDKHNNIYITNWGGAPAYAGHEIHKISPDGTMGLYIDSPLLKNPQGITINHQEEIIVHSDRKLYKVDPSDSTLHLWVNTGYVLGNMVFRKKDSSIYTTGNNKILRISNDGDVSIIAGSTEGYRDGKAETALFDSPLGVEFSPGEDTIYVSEAGYLRNKGRLRRIHYNEITHLFAPMAPQLIVYPNPASDYIKLDQSFHYSRIEIFTMSGEKVQVKAHFDGTYDIRALDPGVYYVNTTGERGMKSCKFIKR